MSKSRLAIGLLLDGFNEDFLGKLLLIKCPSGELLIKCPSGELLIKCPSGELLITLVMAVPPLVLIGLSAELNPFRILMVDFDLQLFGGYIMTTIR